MPPDERRRSIITATLPLLIEHGEMATTKQIAEAAGVAEGTIFRAFADKDALIAAVVQAAVDPGPLEAALAAIDPELPFEQQVTEADLVIGAVLIPGAAAPKLVSNELVSRMKPGSVLVDIAVDQGGCFEDTRPTTHADPTYQVHNSTFYCVANMPGAVPNTSTYALTNATLPYVVAVADKGWQQASRDDHSLALGLNTHAGRLTNAAVGAAVGIAADPLDSVLT